MLGPTRVSEARHEAPGSLRARFGSPHNDSHNAAHGSDSVNSAHREIKFFFPDCEYMLSHKVLGHVDALMYTVL